MHGPWAPTIGRRILEFFYSLFGHPIGRRSMQPVSINPIWFDEEIKEIFYNYFMSRWQDEAIQVSISVRPVSGPTPRKTKWCNVFHRWKLNKLSNPCHATKLLSLRLSTDLVGILSRRMCGKICNSIFYFILFWHGRDVQGPRRALLSFWYIKWMISKEPTLFRSI